MGGANVVQPITHGSQKCCTTHAPWAFYTVVQCCMAHGSRDLVMLYGPSAMGKKSLKGLPELPKRAQDGDSDEVGIANRNAPDATFVVLCLQFLVKWHQNVEYGKGAGDVKEQGSKSKMFVGVNPVIELCCGVREHHQPSLFPLDLAPNVISLLPQRSSKERRRGLTRIVSSQ